jgi:hypothetical protein
MVIRKKSVILKAMWNMQMHSMSTIQSCGMLKYVVHSLTSALKGWYDIAICILPICNINKHVVYIQSFLLISNNSMNRLLYSELSRVDGR